MRLMTVAGWPQAAERTVEFFTAQIRTPPTRGSCWTPSTPRLSPACVIAHCWA